MLYLRFNLDGQEYAIDTSNVIEIAPLVKIKKGPGNASYIAGIMNYRGKPIPVMDLTMMILGREFSPSMNTRIIITQVNDNNTPRLVGVITEHINGVINKDEIEFFNSNNVSGNAAYLGNIAIDQKYMIQTVLIENLLLDKLNDMPNLSQSGSGDF